MHFYLQYDIIILPIMLASCLMLSATYYALNYASITDWCLHTFVDASQEAYGAAVYMKVEYQDGFSSVCLVASKTKVAPLQIISTARLELMGAVLGNRLAKSVTNALSMETKSITFWTDSANVLWWIRGYSHTFKPFVANRVGEIQMSSSPEHWRHVPITMNPADYLTHGVKLVEILNLKSWWEGPEYLRKDEQCGQKIL